MGEIALDIQHVGSTSVPGMAAKPILDIAIAVASFGDGTTCIAPIQALGYEYRGEFGIPGRHYFVKGSPRTHHIHMFELASRNWREMIAFRDYLISHPAAAEEYAVLKRKLASKFENDREAYLDGKTGFVEGSTVCRGRVSSERLGAVYDQV